MQNNSSSQQTPNRFRWIRAVVAIALERFHSASNKQLRIGAALFTLSTVISAPDLALNKSVRSYIPATHIMIAVDACAFLRQTMSHAQHSCPGHCSTMQQ